MLLCFCAIGVKAADTNGSVKFNSGVRYSQWAINSRLHDFYGNQKKFGFDYYDNNGTLTKGVTWYKLDGKTEVTRTFDYVAGLVGKASLEAADFYENFEWSKPWFYAAQGYATTGTHYANTDMTLDNMNAAKMYFPILAGKLKSDAATKAANTAIAAVIKDMSTYNSTYVIGSGKSALNSTNANDVQKTMFGGWFHKSTDYTDQMWCDGQYMGPALLAQIIKHTGKTNNISDNDWDIIANQFSITWTQLYDKNTGLLYHGFTANPGDDASKSWAGISKEKGIYHSASFWGRANAWYFLALVDILEVMPKDNTYYNTFKNYLSNLATGIAKYQDETTGCWYQVMDKVPASLTGNYLEASCSSIFTAGYLKAIRLGLLDKATYEPIAKKAYEGLVNQFMIYDNKDNSTIQLVHSCTSAGLGGKDGRAGNDNYYLTGKDASVVTSSDPTSKYYYTEGKVLGGFIMAATEYERAYQNQDSKQILFARDLAPSYDFTTTDGKLDATAYGSVDGITYQWYKDGKAIADATSARYATYTPTVTGKYYCVATANGKTITTSTTTVKAKSNSNTGNGSTDNSEVIYDFTGSVGTTSYGKSCTIDNNVIKFGSNFSAKDGKYITIKPKTDGFKAGDVITLEGYCDSKNLSGVIIYSDVVGSSIFKSNVLAKSADGGSKFTYTIEKDCDALYLGRYGGGTTCLTSLQVERPASSSNKTRLTASFERNADVVVNTTTVTLPALTVKAGETTLTADKDYNVVYKSNAENVATLSGNTITINSLGIATITATVTPTDANTYEGTTATYQLSVKAPSPLNVSVMDVTINTTDAEEEQPVIKVYGDNDKLLKLGQDYTLSFDVSGDKNVTVDNKTGKFSVTKNAEKTAFIKGTSLITVTATPTASLRSNYIAGTLQFSYSVSEGKIKPVFLNSFNNITINLHQDSNNRTITVPLIHDGEDVSSYFKYTYKVTAQANGQIQEFTENTLNYTPSTAGTYTVTVSAKPDPNGTNDYSDVYDNPESITFTLNVDSKYQTISVTPDPTSIKMYAGTTRVAPDLTVKTETRTLAYTEYNTLWFSTSPGVVKVNANTGKIEAVSEGTAKIRVVVTGENLESTTALITVEVDDPAMYRVKGPGIGETYENHTRMWNQDKNMSVVLGGWLFSDDVKKIVATPNTSKEGLSAGYYWGPGATKAKWKLTGFDYYVAGDNNKNARQENGSNALPETTNIYSADFKSYTGTIKDKMFNVPCSGSYLEFNPVTNGKVTVHIFQNGAFDSGVYRPQRRVFVMDEAGNFVESEAHIETTSGKPTGGIQPISNYTWDLNPKGKDTAPTIEEVRRHFKGIPDTFDMTANAFKNDVYESLLSNDLVPNAAAGKGNGSLGWSVLADSPVTYTFNVKAGKTYYLYNFGSKIGFYGFSFDETKPTVDEVSYADDQSNTITATAAGHVAKVTVNRSMKKDVWTTCVLPFSLNRQQVDAIFGPAYSAAYPQGTQILYFDRVEGNKVFFVRHAYNTIVAGKPFLIKPTKDVTSINTAEVTDYPYVTIENTEPADWCSDNVYTWASSYSNDMIVKKGDGFISNRDGSFKNFVDESGTLKGFRGYLKRLNTQAGAKPMMLQVVSSSNVDGDNGETTGIEDLIIDADGQLMPANGKVYNINGQLVSEDANSFQSLPSGIYIINGKKYIK